jgi:tetratricopeptide (TPR) repeat protein
MGQSHPLTGIGMDGYGYFYRQERDAGAIVLPGASVVTNAAHNVVVDFFAYGGYPLLVAYLFFLAVGGYSLVKLVFRNKKFNPVFAAISVAWICYQAQSIISINQIGLAVWGWVLTGALVGYEFSTRIDATSESTAKSSTAGKKSVVQTQNIFSPSLIGGLGMVLGVLVAIPPYNADAKWRDALASGNIEQVEAALTPTYMTPSDSNRLAQAVNILEQNKLYDQAYKYAKFATEFNPNYFDAWKMLYYISKSTEADKKEALKNLKRLDPLNPDVLGLPS